MADRSEKAQARKRRPTLRRFLKERDGRVATGAPILEEEQFEAVR